MNKNLIQTKPHKLSKKDKQHVIERIAGFMKSRDEIVFAYVYGSFVEDLPFHDIDIVVYVSNVKKDDNALHALDLTRILSDALRMETDVRILNFAPVSFLYHVIQGNLIFERDEDTRVQIMEDTIRKYLDLKPLIRRSIKEAFAA